MTTTDDHKVCQHVTVKLSGGRLVDAEIKAIHRNDGRNSIAGLVWE